MATITVEGGPTIDAQDGRRLVLCLEDGGVDILHRCGGNARCTTCRVAVLSEPEPPMGETEHNSLDEDGVLGQFRLSCQIRVHQDLDVRVLMRASEQGWDPGIELEP